MPFAYWQEGSTGMCAVITGTCTQEEFLRLLFYLLMPTRSRSVRACAIPGKDVFYHMTLPERAANVDENFAISIAGEEEARARNRAMLPRQ